MNKGIFLSLIVFCAGVVPLPAYTPAPTTDGQPERVGLYTTPDPESTGGITGKIIRPTNPLEQILAIPRAAQEKAYAGEITGPNRDTFQFEGLPMGQYDLVAIYRDQVYEGIRLTRGDSSLTPDDLKKIESSLEKSEPYFPAKKSFRIEGETGRGNSASIFAMYFRDQPSSLTWSSHEGSYERSDHRLTWKLIHLKDVGPGWQIVRARDLYPVWVEPGSRLPQHQFRDQLSRVRVADGVRDMGDLDLSR